MLQHKAVNTNNISFICIGVRFCFSVNAQCVVCVVSVNLFLASLVLVLSHPCTEENKRTQKYDNTFSCVSHSECLSLTCCTLLTLCSLLTSHAIHIILGAFILNV